MRDELTERLNNWVSSLDRHIHDLQSEIITNEQAVGEAKNVRSDVRDLVEYLAKEQMPEPVRRALLRCLAWNPHAPRNLRDLAKQATNDQ